MPKRLAELFHNMALLESIKSGADAGSQTRDQVRKIELTTEVLAHHEEKLLRAKESAAVRAFGSGIFGFKILFDAGGAIIGSSFTRVDEDGVMELTE